MDHPNKESQRISSEMCDKICADLIKSLPGFLVSEEKRALMLSKLNVPEQSTSDNNLSQKTNS